jgi:hypothetical protein
VVHRPTLLFLFCLYTSGCTVSGLSTLPCEQDSISYGDVSAFGSLFPGGSFLDESRSRIVPKGVLSALGSLDGHWFSSDRLSKLVVDACDADQLQKCPATDTSFTDNFRIRIIDGDRELFQYYFNAAYSNFRIYGADLDGDAIDEVIMEYGQGRGTFVYVRKLLIGKPGPRHLLTIFESELNNYIGGEPEDNRRLPDPDTWMRRYAFTGPDRDGKFDVELCLLPPTKTPLFLGLTEWTQPLQFPKLVYSFNPTIKTYELRNFIFRPLR